MGLFSSILDPGNLFSGNSGDTLYNMFDPGSGIGETLGVGGFFGDLHDDTTDYMQNQLDFEGSQLSDWLSRTKQNPGQLLVGAGDPFSTKVWNKVLDKEWTPYVNQYGGPDKSAYQSAQEKGIDTSNAQGSHAVAQLVASYFGGGAASSGFGAAGQAAGIGTQAGQTIGSGLSAGGSAWANDGDFWQGAVKGAAPGLMNFLGGFNGAGSTVSDSLSEMGVNKGLANGLVNVGKGAISSGIGSAASGGSFKEGALKGAGTSALSQGIGAGMNMYNGGTGGNTYWDQQPGSQEQFKNMNYSGTGGGLQNIFGQQVAQQGQQGNAPTPGGMSNMSLASTIGAGLMGLHGANQAKKDINSQIGQLNSLFGQDSAYAQTLQQQLARKDAAAGRRSQGGVRGVELQARLAQMAQGNQPLLNQLYGQKKAQDMSQYKDIYAMLSKSGLMDKLGDMGKNYFTGMQTPQMPTMSQPQQFQPEGFLPEEYFNGGY